MTIKTSLARIESLLAQIAAAVAISNKTDLFDVNIIAEDILRPVLAIAYDLPDLVNLNLKKRGAAAIDLGDSTAGVAIQVTSRTDNEKVKEMLQGAVKHRRYDEFPTLRLLVLKEDGPAYKAAGWEKIIDGRFGFDRSHILTLGDIYRNIRGEPSKIRAVLQSLEETVGNGSFFSFAELQHACREVTDATVRIRLEKRTTIERDELSSRIDTFTRSDLRYAFVAGRSGVGKSIHLATEALRLRDAGFTVLLVPVQPGISFSLKDVADQVGQRLPLTPPHLEWSRIVRPWESVETTSDPAEQMIIMIDGVEAGDPIHIANQLALLDRSLALHSASAAKVVFSCRDAQVEDLLREEILVGVPSFNHRPADRMSEAPLKYDRIDVDDFSYDELDRALAKIGAGNLFSANDLHGSSMRSLLQHPGTFEHFADLFARGEIDEARSETWSSLLRRRIDFCLAQAERFCDASTDEMRQLLVRMSQHCWESELTEFAVTAAKLMEVIPELFAADEKGRSIYSALIRTGVLRGKDTVEFAITDAGPYLLSFELEKQFAAKEDSERKGLVSKWLRDRWNYWPLLDAVLALIDRLSDDPDINHRNLLAIVEAMVATHHDNDLFRLLRPSVLGTIFKLVKVGDNDRLVYTYRDPALHVRLSNENTTLIEINLKDPSNENARELAANLAGYHRIVDLVPELVTALQDEGEHVREASYKALSRIGEPALPALVASLRANHNDPVRARQIVWAIIGVGFHSDELSQAVDELFKATRPDESDEINRLREVLLFLSGVRRDKLQAAHAAVALGSQDARLSKAAAKYFAEAPSAEIFDDLVARLHATDMSAKGAWEGEWFASQLIAAILSVDRMRGEPIITEFLIELFEGDEISHKGWVMDIAEKHSLPKCLAVIYDRLIRRLKTSDTKVEHTWFGIAEQMINIWAPEVLAAVRLAAEELCSDGIDPAEVVADSLLPHLSSEGDRYGDRLNRITDLRLAVIAGGNTFGREAVRLFEVAPRFGSRDLANFFWILRDTSFEAELIATFEKEIAKNKELEESDRRLTASFIARALSTCGSRAGAEAVLKFMFDDPVNVIHRDFAVDVLVPLLTREIISGEELAEEAENPDNHAIGRALCIEALATHDGAAHFDLFRRLAETSDDTTLLGIAVTAMGMSGVADASVPLRRVIRRTDVSEGVRGRAARALAILNDRESLPDIVDAFLDLETYEGSILFQFVGAIRHFCPTTAERMLDTIETKAASNMQLKARIGETRIQFPVDPGNHPARVRLLEEATESQRGFRDPQKEIVHMMIEDGSLAGLETIAVYLEKDRLTSGSKQEIIRHIRKLSDTPSVDREALIRLFKPLMVNEDPYVRYSFLALLSLIDPSIPFELYLRCTEDSPDEWTLACAVESLGYWDSDPEELAARRWNSSHLVRQFANQAISHGEDRRRLDFHLERLLSSDGLERLQSFLSIKYNGDRNTIRRLYGMKDELGEHSIEAILIDELIGQTGNELDRKHRNLDQDEKKLREERNRISFD